jgi:hypothetical protein
VPKSLLRRVPRHRVAQPSKLVIALEWGKEKGKGLTLAGRLRTKDGDDVVAEALVEKTPSFDGRRELFAVCDG